LGKNPAFQFYPADWTRDLLEHPLEIEGAWIRIICKLWWEHPKGTASKTTKEWDRILGVNSDDSYRIFLYLKKAKIADVSIKVTDGNKIITVKSRRMHREWKAKESNRLRQQRHRRSRKRNGKVTSYSSYLHSSYKEKSDISVTKNRLIKMKNGTVKPLNEILTTEDE